MKKLFLIPFLMLLFVQQSMAQNASNGKITLEDIWMNYAYFPQFPEEFRWMNDDQYYSVLDMNENQAKQIVRYKIEDETTSDIILDLSNVSFGEGITSKNIQSYKFSPDEQKILLIANRRSIYRRSSRETCFIYDRQTEKLYTLHNGKPVSNATFSPDGSKVGYVFDNNLYYHDLTDNKQVQVTEDGSYNKVINGHTDWVYEEEFAIVQGFYWSPDNKKIAYYRFNESEVKEFNMAMYGSLYPDEYRFKYPKAGEDNAIVDIYIYDLKKKKSTKADLGYETDQYVPRIKWTEDPKKLAIMRMNRLQNKLDVLIANANNGKTEVLLTEKNETYIDEVSDKKWFFTKKDELIWTSEINGYNHIFRYDKDGKLMNEITKGSWEVSEVVSIDEDKEKIYYLSTEVSSLERHLYSVDFKGKKNKQLTEAPGTHEITFSSSHNYYVDSYSSVEEPGKTVLYNAKGKEVKVVADNQPLKNKLASLDISKPEFMIIKNDKGIEMNAWMIKPKDFNDKRKYPVLMFVYGGPGSQTVKNEFGMFNYMWFQMLAQQGYLVVSVDNRGTGGRGEKYKKATYADLGKLETEDQIAAAKYLQTLKYVDKDRIGIWGWSYGGYMTSLCMTKGEGLFKAGIAVAPVTNWRFYDTIYTERYLKTPQLNADGYDKNSPINFADQLQGSYLLVHGSADDNVHMQNTMEWVNSLVRANKQFDMFIYPDKNHGIYGGVTRYHLYKKMTDFLLEHL